MPTHLPTGKTGTVAEMLAVADEYQRARWNNLIMEGRSRLALWRANAGKRRQNRISPTRFYKLMYGYK